MQKKTVKQELEIYDFSELSGEQQNLLLVAKSMLEKAYAPYSNFLVGAAALLEDGQVMVGCNQENASYPLCICAERVALYNAGANATGTKIKSLAVIAKNPKNALLQPVSPCGACRQVILEFEEKQEGKIEILLQGETDEVYRIETAADLLPLNFSGSVLL